MQVLLKLVILCGGTLASSFFNSYYGPLDSIHVVLSDLAIGISNDYILGLRLGGGEDGDGINNIAWKAKSTGHNSILVCHNTLYAYHNQSRSIDVYSARAGVFQKSIKVNGPVKSIHCVHNLGALVHTDIANSVYYIHGATATFVEENSVTHFAVFESDWGVRVLINNTTLALFDPTDILLKQIEGESEILKEAMDVSQLYARVKTVPQQIQANCGIYYVVDDKTLQLYGIVNSEMVLVSELVYPTQISQVYVRQYGLSKFVLVKSDATRWDILDLTDYLLLKDVESIKRVRVNSEHTLPFIHTDSTHELYLTIIDADGSGQRFQLSDGSLLATYKSASVPLTASTHALITDIDSPRSSARSKHIPEQLGDNILTSYIKRVRKHAIQLAGLGAKMMNGEFYESLTVSGPASSSLNALLVVWDEELNNLIAMNTADGSLAWNCHLGLDPLVEILEARDGDLLWALFPTHLYNIQKSNGKIVSQEKTMADSTAIKNLVRDSLLSQSFFVSRNGNCVSGNILPHGSTKAHQTWSFCPQNLKIVDFVSKSAVDSYRVASVGIPLADKSVLYKYLNPNLSLVITLELDSLTIYLIDGITGSVLYTQTHAHELIDLESVSGVVDENWVVYTYYTKSPSLEQRIVVLDLFLSGWAPPVKSLFQFNSTIDQVFTKSYGFAQRITHMAVTNSLQGITSRSIVVATDTGQLVELPKYILDSRRGHPQNLSAFEHAMPPYKPFISATDYKILSSHHQLDTGKDKIILTKPTRFESTIIVCYVGKHQQTCTLTQPSQSFDILGATFDKTKLILTTAGLFLAYMATKPFVAKRKLANEWLD